MTIIKLKSFDAQVLLSDQGVAGGHDRGWGPSEPSRQPQTSSILSSLQGKVSLHDQQ